MAFLWTQVHPPWKSYRFNPGRIYSHLSSVLGLCASGILLDIGIIRWDLGYRAQSPFRSNVVKPHVSNHYSQSDVRKLSHVTRKLLEARENAGDQLAFGFSFESVCLWGWREFSEPITQWSREKQAISDYFQYSIYNCCCVKLCPLWESGRKEFSGKLLKMRLFSVMCVLCFSNMGL